MKWLGQHIVDFIARFRSDVYLEDLTTDTSTDILVVDSDGKICKNADAGDDMSFTVAATTTGTGTTITDGDSLTIAAGTGITTTGTSDGVVTIANTVTDTNTNQLTTFTLTGDSGSDQTIAHGNTLDIAGGNGITTVVSATDTITINHDDTSSQASSNNSGNTVIQDIAIDTYGHVTSLATAEITSVEGAILAESAVITTNVTVTANNTANETVYPTFVDGATGSQGIETDTGLTYNPNTNVLTAVNFAGALAGDASGSSGSCTGNAATATLASTTTITDKSDDVDYDVVFGNSTSALYDDTGTLTYNPNDAALSSTNFVGALTGNASGTAATVTSGTQASITTCANLTTVGTIGTGVWNGDAIATTYIADDAVTFAKAVGVTPNVFGTYIKLLPSDFVANIDGGNTKFGVGYVNTAGDDYGINVANAATELFAFVSIPEDMKATHVEVFGRRAKAVEVFEVQINATTMASKGTGTCGIPADTIGDEEFALSSEVTSTATNLLVIEVTVTSNSADKVYGARVKIAAV